MLALPATSSATPSLQGTLNRSRADATRRAADQLEAQAQDLRAQADQQEAQSSKEPQARLPAPPTRADESVTYTAQIKSAKAAVPPATQDFLLRLYKATSAKFAANGNALKSDQNAPAVVNAQGQSTGRILNIEA